MYNYDKWKMICYNNLFTIVFETHPFMLRRPCPKQQCHLFFNTSAVVHFIAVLLSSGSQIKLDLYLSHN